MEILYGLSGQQTGFFIQVGENVAFQILDSFGAYPLNFTAELSQIPAGWYVPRMDLETEELGFRIIQDPNVSGHCRKDVMRFHSEANVF